MDGFTSKEERGNESLTFIGLNMQSLESCSVMLVNTAFEVFIAINLF